jgi:hypothetical protein
MNRITTAAAIIAKSAHSMFGFPDGSMMPPMKTPMIPAPAIMLTVRNGDVTRHDVIAKPDNTPMTTAGPSESSMDLTNKGQRSAGSAVASAIPPSNNPIATPIAVTVKNVAKKRRHMAELSLNAGIKTS